MSNYSGTLITVGSYTIDTATYIKADSYSVTRQIQDLDSYRDENGILRRNALSHVPIKVEFETPAMLTDSQMATLMSGIRSNYSDSSERKASVTVYVPETDSYETQDMYMADPQFSMYGNYNGVIHYNPVRFAFIGY